MKMLKFSLIAVLLILHSAESYAKTSGSMFEGMLEWVQTSGLTNAGMREVGCYITLDTATGQYGITNIIEGPIVFFPDEPYIDFPINNPPDIFANSSPTSTAVYIVGWFHTHAPMVNVSVMWARDVGPSPSDYQVALDMGLPGLVYDYIEDEPGSGEIPGGHPIDAPAKLYPITPPERRATP